MNRRSGMLAALACTAALASGTVAADEVKVIAVTKAKGTALDDMKVTRDKDTGRLRAATPEEIQAMSRGTASYAPNVVVLSRPATTVLQRADGSGVVRRSLEDLDNVVATRRADGKTILRHGEGHAPAATNPLPKE